MLATFLREAALEPAIQRSLKESRYLIVVCSPQAAAPQSWVNKEIAYFKTLGREGNILAIILDGEPNASNNPRTATRECFPPALRYQINKDGSISTERANEPLAADSRLGAGFFARLCHRFGLRLVKRDAFLRLVAAILNVTYDTLRRRDQERQRLTARIRLAVGLSIFTIQPKANPGRACQLLIGPMNSQVAWLANISVLPKNLAPRSRRLREFKQLERVLSGRQGAITSVACSLTNGTWVQGASMAVFFLGY